MNKNLHKRLDLLWNDLLALIDMKVKTDMSLLHDTNNIKKHSDIHGKLVFENEELRFCITEICDVNSTVKLTVFENKYKLSLYVSSFGEITLGEITEDVTAEKIDEIITCIENKVKSYRDALTKACNDFDIEQKHRKEVLVGLSKI